MNFQNAIRRVEGVESFQVIVTKEDEADITSRDRVIVYASLFGGADEEIARSEITHQIKLDTEISPDQVVIEKPETIEMRLFERTGLKADWVIDKRELQL